MTSVTSFSEAEGFGIHYARGPKGAERVFWVHGYTLDSTIWNPLWQRLNKYHHIGVDLPGHGKSRPLRPDDDLPAVARRLSLIAASHGAKHIVGLSFGGMVAIQLAIDVPNEFLSLVLGSPALGGGPQDPHAQVRNLALMRMHNERGNGPWLRHLWMQWPPAIFKGASNNPRLWKDLCDVIDRHSWAELGSLQMMRFVSYPQSDRLLARIRASTLLISGDDDMRAFKRTAHIIKQKVRSCERIHLVGVGHLSLLEAPDLVAPMIDHHIRASAS
jgi:pimeloyl-ACP methyl ester carboxylesterase